MPTPKIGLLTEIKLKAAALDERVAKSYRAGLRDAVAFLNAVESLPESLAAKKQEMIRELLDAAADE